MNTFNELFLAAYNFYTDGLFNLAAEKLDEAELVYEKSDTNEFSLEDLFILRGTCKFSQHEYEEARVDFEKALNTNPNSSEACLGLGKYFIAIRLDEKAKVMLEWAVRNNPSHPGARKALSELNAKLGLDIDDNSVLVNDRLPQPNENSNLINVASDLFVQKKYSEAIEKLNAAKKEHETFLASLENFIAFNYLGLQNIEAATESAERALKLNPYSSQAYATLGEINFMKNKPGEAKAKFNLALSYNKDNEFAKQGLQKVENMLNNMDATNGNVNSDLESLIAESLSR